MIETDSLAQVIAGPRPSGTLIMLMGTGGIEVTYTWDDLWQTHTQRHHAPGTHYVHLSDRCSLWRIEADDCDDRDLTEFRCLPPVRFVPPLTKLTVCVAVYAEGKISEMTLRPAIGLMMDQGHWR